MPGKRRGYHRRGFFRLSEELDVKELDEPKVEKHNGGKSFEKKLLTRNTQIAKLTAMGLSQNKVAKEMEKEGWHVTKNVVNDVMQKPDIRLIMEQERERLISLVPKAVSNYKTWIDKAQTYRDKTDKEIAFKATTKVLESNGLVSGTPSTQIQIMNNSGNTLVSPIIEGLLKMFVDKLNNADIIDGEVIEG